jgi:hypothetical protein
MSCDGLLEIVPREMRESTAQRVAINVLNRTPESELRHSVNVVLLKCWNFIHCIEKSEYPHHHLPQHERVE